MTHLVLQPKATTKWFFLPFFLLFSDVKQRAGAGGGGKGKQNPKLQYVEQSWQIE